MSSHTELNQRPASCSGVELNSERRQSAQLPDASSGTPTVIAATRLSQPGVTAQPIAVRCLTAARSWSHSAPRISPRLVEYSVEWGSYMFFFTSVTCVRSLLASQGTPWCNTVWAYNMPSAQSALQGHA